MMKSILWLTAKLTAVLSIWVLSLVLAIGSTWLMGKINDLRGMLPALPLSVLDLKDDVIKKSGVELENERSKGQKVKEKIKVNADRSKKRTMAAAKRLPAEELVDLLGPLGVATGVGFIAYDLADICWEIHDQNELLDLIGEPLMENPFVDGCEAVGETANVWVIKAKSGWNYIVTKSQDGWEQTKVKVDDLMEAMRVMREIAIQNVANGCVWPAEC